MYSSLGLSHKSWSFHGKIGGDENSTSVSRSGFEIASISSCILRIFVSIQGSPTVILFKWVVSLVFVLLNDGVQGVYILWYCNQIDKSCCNKTRRVNHSLLNETIHGFLNNSLA